MKRIQCKFFVLFASCILIYISIGAFSYHCVKKQMDAQYNEALQKVKDGAYLEAKNIFSQLENYKDSVEQVKHIDELIEYDAILVEYEEAKRLFESGQYDLSAEKFKELGAFKDSQELAKSATQLSETDKKYEEAKTLFENRAYSDALDIFQEIDDYKDSSDLSQKCQVAITRLSNASTIAAGIRYSGCVNSYGRVLFSGESDALKKELASWRDIVSIAINGHIIVGLKNDGRVVTAGQVSGYYIDTSNWDDIVAVSAGQAYIVGLKSDGTLIAQGHTGDGQINKTETDDDGLTIVTDSIMDWTNIVAISTGWRHTVGLDSFGEVHIAGAGADTQLRQIEAAKDDPKRAWTGLIAISAGGGHRIPGHTVGLREDGTVVAVGNNSNGQCNVYGDDWKNIVAIAAGDTHTVGLKSDGTIIIAGSRSMTDTVSKWNDIEGLKFVSIAAGMETTLALTPDGTVYGTGYHKNDQLAFCNNGMPNPSSGMYESEWDNVLIHEEWQSKSK